jgi:hypothetical protein
VSDVGLRLQPLSEVEPRNVRWLVPGLIPLRTLTLVAGVGGLGKSMWLIGVGARLSCGDLEGHPPGDTVIVSYEDTAEEVLRPRVEAARGDPARVHQIVPEHRDWVGPVAMPRDLPQVERLVRSVETKLVVIDPIVAGIDVEFDAHKDQHVRVVLAGLAELAEEADCAVAMVVHLNKAPSTDAYIRIANSVGFYNAARSVVLVTEDNGGGDDLRLVTQRKANYARLRPVERHRVEPIVLPQLLDPVDGKPIETARMVFVEFADDVDAADVLAGSGRRDDKTARAVEFLTQALADGDWHESAGVKKLAGAAGIAERTLQLAAQSLNVESERRGFPSSTWWRITLACASEESVPQPPQTRNGLTPKSCATEDTAWLSGSQGSDTPVAPVAQSRKQAGEPPLPGDDGFLAYLLDSGERGLITEREFTERAEVHDLILRGRAAATGEEP